MVSALIEDVLGESRAALLDEIGTGRDLTLVRPLGNLGDELILAGTRTLLDGIVHREIDVDEIPSSSGDTVLICGGGAWCRPYHAWAPRATRVASLSFARVIVLPSSFDVSVDEVRDCLQCAGATVFAREQESYRHIQGLCRARLAHDCAFFYDFSPYRADGAGTLNAFRGDAEATAGALTVSDNDDISVTAASLEDWLQTIAGHAHVRTDRAHVMIAAAMLGKTVEFAPSSYHKLDSLAQTWLGAYPVAKMAPPRTPRRSAGRAWQAPSPAQLGAPRVTVVVVTQDRCELALAAVGSALRAMVALRVLVIGNNPSGESREALTRLAAEDPRIELRVLDRNLGCAGGRRLGSELAETELVMFLDDDAELLDGALEHLCRDLDAHPEAVGVTAQVIDADGTVQHCGGELERSDELARFVLGGSGLPRDDAAVPATGDSGWLPGTAALIRAQALREIPLHAGPLAYYEDNDWAMRVGHARVGAFRRCREAIVRHHNDWTPVVHSCELVRVAELAELLNVQAGFLHRYGVLLDVDLAHRLPELARSDGVDLKAVRLLLDFVGQRGTDWFIAEWMSGGLEPLLERGRRVDRQQDELGALAASHAQLSAELVTERAELVRLATLSAERGGRIRPLRRAATSLRRWIAPQQR